MKIQTIAVAFFIAGTVAFLDNEARILQETASTTVTFASTLPCGGCIRGGNIFCAGPSAAKPSKCCKTATECATEIADKTYLCSNTVKSQFNSLYKVCTKSQSAAVCGKDKINLQAVDASEAINITALPVGSSCTYRVMSKCGFPAFDANNTNIDVTVVKQQGKGETDDVPDNETLSADSVAIPRGKGGKISFNMGEGQKDPSCDKMRKLYVTITNIPPAANTTRILQTATT